MKDLKIKKQSKTGDFLTSKGFYLTLIVSLTMLGSTMWFIMNKSIDNVIDKNLKLTKNSFSNSHNTLKTVNNVVHNVPIQEKNKNETSASHHDNEHKLPETSMEPSQTSPNNISSDDKSILFVPPLVGKIINDFSAGELVKNKTLSDWRVHNAIDISAPQGTPVKSIADGEVIKIYVNPMLGTCIEIEHENNINSVYCSLNKNVNVTEGDIVEAGDVIGSVGNTAIGESELGDHLHFEIKEKGEKINPLTKIKIS